MQMTPEARAWLHATVRRIMARQPLGEAERTGITYELMSHLHAAGEARATAAGRGEVTPEDLEGALAEAGGDEGLAAAFVQPLARPFERVLFGRRFAAFAIDTLLLGITLSFVHGALVFLLAPFMGDTGSTHEHAQFGLWWLMPWGFHDPSMAFLPQALIAIASAVTVLGYFTWFEGQEGYSPGKRAMQLRVMRADGGLLTYRDSLIRNLVKVVPPLLVLDTVMMLVAFGEEKQRLSDRIAETAVVRA
jgi:uncharacterized RDD family membrane protein YckC